MNSKFLIVTIMIFGCSTYKIPKNGIQIGNLTFEQLIIDQSVKSMIFHSAESIIEIELTEMALQQSDSIIKEFQSEGKINDATEFRLYCTVARFESINERIQQIQIDNSLPKLNIEIH